MRRMNDGDGEEQREAMYMMHMMQKTLSVRLQRYIRESNRAMSEAKFTKHLKVFYRAVTRCLSAM